MLVTTLFTITTPLHTGTVYRSSLPEYTIFPTPFQLLFLYIENMSGFSAGKTRILCLCRQKNVLQENGGWCLDGWVLNSSESKFDRISVTKIDDDKNFVGFYVAGFASLWILKLKIWHVFWGRNVENLVDKAWHWCTPLRNNFNMAR